MTLVMLRAAGMHNGSRRIRRADDFDDMQLEQSVLAGHVGSIYYQVHSSSDHHVLDSRGFTEVTAMQALK